MGQGRRYAAGKIQQVCAAVREYEAALRRDIVALGDGLRLDDGRLSWDDLHAVIFSAPPNTAFFHEVEKGWTTSDYLAAIAADALAVLVWQNTEDGQKDRRRPKKLPRPVRGEDEGTAPTGFGGRATVMPVEEFERRRAERQRKWVERNGKKRRRA